MSDRDTRALERRAAAGDLDARARLDRALERSGAVAALEAEVEAALARLQREGTDAPSGATLHRLDVGQVVRSVLEVDEPGAWRLTFGEVRGDARATATFAAATIDGDLALVALGRGVPAEVLRDLPRGTGFDLPSLEAVSDPERFEVVRCPAATAGAWARGEAVSAHEALQETLAPVRRRPAMFFGSLDARGAARALDELLATGVTEAFLGHGMALSVTLHADGSCTVRDDGRPASERPAAVTTVLPGIQRLQGPLGPRLGLAPVAAMCAWLEVAALGGSVARVRRYERGCPVGEEVERVEPGHGLAVRFLLDPALFPPAAALTFERVERRARELAHLVAGLQLTVTEEVEGRAAACCAPAGLADWLASALPEGAIGPIHAAGRRQDAAHGELRVEAALAWCPDARAGERRFVEVWPVIRRRSTGPHLASYVHGELTRDGGDHAVGLREGAQAALERLGVDVESAAWRDGFVGVVSVFGADLAFHGASRDRLVAPRARELVASVVQSAVRAWAREEPGSLDDLRRGTGVRPPRERRRWRR